MQSNGDQRRGGQRCAAKYVTYANFDATPEVFKHKSNVLAEHCKDVGTDFGAIVRSANFDVVIGETDKDVAEKMAWLRNHFADAAYDQSSIDLFAKEVIPGLAN